MNELERYKFISLGLGVQSTALYYMSSLGELPAVIAAIFVDTGREKTGTMRYLKYLINWKEKNNGLPIIIISKKNLFLDLLNNRNSAGRRFSSIPAYTHTPGKSQEGMLLRQCTGEYKIKQVDATIRKYLEVKNLRGKSIEVWKGITIDEWDRMSEPAENWKHHIYPFTGYEIQRLGKKKFKSTKLNENRTRKMTRIDVIAWYNKKGLPIPPKSSCVFCPYQSDLAWADMKQNEPDDFEDACRVDEAIRDSTKKGIIQKVYLHDSLVPLRNVNFTTNDMWKGECSGNCHI